MSFPYDDSVETYERQSNRDKESNVRLPILGVVFATSDLIQICILE